MRNMLIGLTGKRGVGKTTAANELIKEYGFFEHSFAYPLKKVCMKLFHLSEEQVFGDYNIKEKVDKRLGVSPREILQKFGTEVMRKHIHELMPDLNIKKGEFWLEEFRYKYESNRDACDGWEYNAVVPDLRFLNEAELIRKLGGIIIKIERPSLKLSESIHSSEMEIDKIQPDYTLSGNGKIEDFRRAVRCLYEELKILCQLENTK